MKNELFLPLLSSRERMICHASGDWKKPVVPGFVFYYVVQQDKNAKGGVVYDFFCTLM